ncbi:MAG: adenosylcobinamide-GDP ribazoletransferase [Candidatus Bathyarchaeia archaeon]
MTPMRGLKSVLAFLTIIPIGKDSGEVREAASNMYLFPIFGAALGFFIGLLGKILSELIPTGLTSTVLTIIILYLVTGLHHFDGLLDFGDGVMAHGSPEEKVSIMRDKSIGAGGFGLGLLNTLLLASCIWSIPAVELPLLMAVSEASAKLVMVLVAVIGKPAQNGLGAIFISTLTGRRGKITLITSLLFTLGVSTLTIGIRGLVGVFSALTVGILIEYISNINFRCVTGDVLGAVNELSRTLSLLTMGTLNWI